MTMLSMLIVIVVLVGSATAAELPPVEEGNLLAHPEPAEQYSKEELLDKLNEVSFYSEHRDALIVADCLYKTRDKKSTVVANDTTVAQLIEQNHIELAGCSQEALKQRVAMWENTAPYGRQHGLHYAVNTYVFDCLAAACDYCLEHQEEVLSGGHNDELWLRHLKVARRSYDDPHEYLGQEVVFNRMTSNMVQFIKTGSNIYCYPHKTHKTKSR